MNSRVQPHPVTTYYGMTTESVDNTKVLRLYLVVWRCSVIHLPLAGVCTSMLLRRVNSPFVKWRCMDNVSTRYQPRRELFTLHSKPSHQHDANRCYHVDSAGRHWALPFARASNDIAIEFEIRPKFAVLWFKTRCTDHHEICTRHDSVTVVTCVQFCCDRSSQILVELRIRSKYC